MLLDQRMQRVARGDPFYQTKVWREGENKIRYDFKVSFGSRVVVGEQRVHQAKQLHHALVLAQVFVSLQEVLIFVSIRTAECDTTRTLLCVHDDEPLRDGLNRDRLVRFEVRAGDDKLEIAGLMKFSGYLLEIEGQERRKSTIDHPAHMLVMIPRQFKVFLVAGSLVLVASLPRFAQIGSVQRNELRLLSGGVGVEVTQLIVQRP
mmetsp:Transcript_13853/g.35638  ORF Transcript_13853/g.35638 Transcript_13853/m.35638 type:complete len:205 (+) Transcript_13853:7546-8160(+)